MTENDSREVARIATAHLLQLNEQTIATYLMNTFRLDQNYGLSVSQMHAVEVEKGSIEMGTLTGLSVRWWSIDQKRIELCSFVDMARYNAASDLGLLWPSPIVKYYTELPKLLTCENIGVMPFGDGAGSPLICYRVFTVGRVNGNLELTSLLRQWLL